MKRFLLLSIALFLLIALVGCRRESHLFFTPVPEWLEFASVEEFLVCYIILREGRTDRDIAEFVWIGNHG